MKIDNVKYIQKINSLMRKDYLSFLVIVILFVGCDEAYKGVPMVDTDDIAPSPVSDVIIENISGGAILSYTLPNSDNLLYVLAEYSRKDGVVSEKKASYYHNSLTLEGFPDTIAYPVNLYAVSRGGKKSDPVSVTIHPLTPPVISVFNSLSVKRTFGGMYVNFENEAETDIKISVTTTDSLSNVYIADTYYTKMKLGNFSIRGFAPEPRSFGVYVSDRWGNVSDTAYHEIVPLFEQKLDKSKFREFHLPGDNWMAHGGRVMERLWDEGYSNNEQFASERGHGFPQSFAFDLGVHATLSRFLLYPRVDASAFLNMPKTFEIWGSTSPNPDGSWDNWVKLLDGEIIKPSGLPIGEVSQEDLDYAAGGIEFEFSPDTPPVRYIRFKTLSVFAQDNVAIWELTFFGQE